MGYATTIYVAHWPHLCYEMGNVWIKIIQDLTNNVEEIELHGTYNKSFWQKYNNILLKNFSVNSGALVTAFLIWNPNILAEPIATAGS